MPTINASAAWQGDRRECVKLYNQFIGYFNGRFAAIRSHYGWTRAAMVEALRTGRTTQFRRGA